MPQLLMLKTLIGSSALLLLSACNVLDDDGGDTESGISGGGVVAGNEQSKVGDGSSKKWASSTWRIVELKPEWRWGSEKHFFEVLHVEIAQKLQILEILPRIFLVN